MRAIPTPLDGVFLLEPRVFADERGFFFESYNRAVFREVLGLDPEFVQDNHSRSVRGVLRGLHYQVATPQGKIVRVTAGEVFDVAVDLREGSPTFRRWHGARLSAENRLQLWIPPGFAHGFLALSEWADLLYKATTRYAPENERTLRWDDPELAVAWPREAGRPLLSPRDAAGMSLAEALAERPFASGARP